MNPITSITQGCDFTLRIRAKRVATRGYVNVSFVEIADIHVNLVNLPATKTPIAYTIDSEGRLLLDIDGDTLDCNSYGIEILGYYNNGNWRHQLAPAFQIVRTSTEDNYALNESDERTIDLIIVIGETYLTTKGFNQAMEEHDQDIHAHIDLRNTISNMATQISDLVTEVANAEDGIGQMQQDVEEAGYQNEQQVEQKVEGYGYQTAQQVQSTVNAAVEASKINEVKVNVDNSTGTPTGTGQVTGQKLTLDLHNIKGEPLTFNDLTPEQKAELIGPQGPQGDSVLVGQGDLPLANTLGISAEKAITQKAVTDALTNEIKNIDFGSLTPVGVYVSNGVWTESSTSQSYFIEVKPGVNYKVTPPSGAGQSRVFFLSDNAHEEGQAPHYVGVTELPDWIREETMLTAPNGAAYMYVRRKNSTTIFTPSIEVRVPSNVKLKDVSQNYEELKQDYDEKNILSVDEFNILTDPTVIDDSTQRLFFINEDNVWKKASSATTNRSVYFPVIPGKTLKVVSQEGGWFRIEFLTEWAPNTDDPVVFATGDPIGTTAGGTHYYVVPPLAKYCYVRRVSSSTNRLPAFIGYVEKTYPNIIENDKNLKKMSDSVGMLYGQTIKPSYRNGAWNGSGYVSNRPGAAVSEEIIVESNVEQLEFVNPCPDKVIYMVYRTTGDTPPYAPMVYNLINRNFTVAHENGVRYVIRLKPAGGEDKDVLNSIQADEYPYVRLKLKDATLVDTENARLEKLIANAKHFAYTYLGNTDTENDTIKDNLALLHYTDLHGDTKAAGKIKMWSRIFGKYINDVLNTGDVVLRCASGTNAYPQGRDWWQKSGLPEISLNLLGNHDSADSSLDWYAMDKDYDFRQYIEPYINSMGVTMPDGYDNPASPNYQACYWHKDYADQKIRLIGLDCLHRFDGIVDPTTGQRVTGSTGIKWDSTEQEEWLVAKLNECLTSGNSAYGYSVVIACHYQLDDYHGANMKAWAERSHDHTDFNRNATGGYLVDYKTGEGTNWQLYQRYPEWEINPQYGFRNRTDATHRGDVNNVGNIIKHFMDNGGKFVVWLSGHVHCDMLYYPDMFPNILVCANTCAGVPEGGTREDRTVERAAANYVVIDTAKSLLKIVRLGVNTSPYLAPINTLCYDYKNRKIMFEQ